MIAHEKPLQVTQPHRDYCYVCFKPAVVCLCDEIVPVDNITKVVIIQHKCERTHPIGTARIANLGLKNSQLEVVWPDKNNKFTFDYRPPARTGLLYPGPNATDLACVDAIDRPRELIVLDGTWRNSRNLYRDNPWMADLPQFSLNPSVPSRYRIRKEPNDQSISTIEAIVQSLSILEPNTVDLDSLINVFESMIDRQVEYTRLHSQDGTTRHVKRRRNRASRAMFPDLKEKFESIIVADGETVPRPGKKRALIRWVAVKPHDGSIFDELIKPEEDATITDNHLKMIRVSPGEINNAIDRDEFQKRWSQFVEPDNVLVTWNKSFLDLFESIVNNELPAFYLKESYCNTNNGRCGHVKDVVRTHELSGPNLPILGRVGKKLSDTVAIAQYLHQLDLPSN